MLPERAASIFSHVDVQNQKAIIDEEEDFYDNDSGVNAGRIQIRYSEAPAKVRTKNMENSLGNGGMLGIPGSTSNRESMK